MDLSLLCTDDQTRSPPALTESQTGDLDALPLHTKSAYETGIEIVSDLSDPTDKSTKPLSNVSKCLSQEKCNNSDCLNPLSSSYKMSKCFSLCSEPAPKDDDFRVHGYFGSSETVPHLPHISQDLISPSPEIYPEHESALSLPLIEENNTPQPFGATSSTLESWTERSVNETFSSSSSEYSRANHLLRSLSHQSDSVESDTAIAPMSELYIFENDTKDFILSPTEDPQEIKCPEYPSLSQTEGKETERDADTHVMMCDSAEVVTQCNQGSTEEWAMANYDTDVSQHTGLRPPAVDACEAGLMSVNDARQGKAEVSHLTPQARRSSSPDLWLDASQYLAGEDMEDKDFWEMTGHSMMEGGLSATSELSFPPGETQVSGYSPDGSDRIGWSSDDTKGWGPPVERWSSVDSWASALSDWTGIITAPPVDITAAFTEIGAEIDALTQALAEVNTHTDTETSIEEQSQESSVQAQSQTLPDMGVQDKPLEAQNIPESSVLCGQTCLSLRLDTAGLELQVRESSHGVESLCDSTPSAKEKKEPGEINSSQAENSPYHGLKDSSMGSSAATMASPGGYSVDVTAVAHIPRSASFSDCDLSHFGGYASLESDIFISNEEVPIILNITEDSDLEGQNAPGELTTEQPFTDAVCEVKEEHRISQPGLVAEKEARRSCGPAEVDGEGTKDSTDPHFLDTRTRTSSHTPGVDTQLGLHINVPTQVSSDTLADLDGARQVEPPWGSPKFIMPLAPLGIGPSLVCQASLERDQTCAKGSLNENRGFSCDHLQPRSLWPTSDGITNTLSLEDDKELTHKKENTTDSAEKSSAEGQLDLYTGDTAECFFNERKTITEEINDLSRELSNLAVVPANRFMISEKHRVAFITLDLNDPFVSCAAEPIAPAVQSQRAELNHKPAEKMPHKTHKITSEGKTRSKKDKLVGHYHGAQTSKKQENLLHHAPAQQTCKQKETPPLPGENHISQDSTARPKDKEDKLVIETSVVAEKATNKPHGKKKKKHGQNATGVKSVGEPLVEVENGTKPKTAKGRTDMFEAKLGAKAGKPQKDSDHSDGAEKKQPQAKPSQAEQPKEQHKGHQPKNFTSPLNDDIIKRRRLSENKFGKIVSVLESKLPKPDVSIQTKGEVPKVDVGATRKKAYSEVVKQKPITPKLDPKVVQPIQAAAVSGDPQSLCLWCQFAAVFTNYTVTWSRDGAVLAEVKRSAGDESRVSMTISNASHKDLGKYQCRLSSLHGSVTLDYLLTYEVLSEIVIPPTPKSITSATVEVGNEEEDVQFSKLMFRDDFLSDQYFGENHLISIITEKAHFGEGMHRRAFRTKLQTGQVPVLLPGNSCVLKVHNAISYGTKNSDELIQKNFNLAVEECQVQNTAREYIKAYNEAAQSVEAFGEVPEIIPIYLVHRLSNDIPYATLEEELIGDFVKYSVKDGKEINLMRRDSEAGRKCCAFQHWVYHKTEGNLLVTDMQGVGMRLTDVGIATCKKGYKGFKGNCAPSFIDQFKALHQCNTYCEILGLKSLQPKPKKPGSAPKPKPQPSAAPKKKTFGPSVKGKS